MFGLFNRETNQDKEEVMSPQKKFEKKLLEINRDGGRITIGRDPNSDIKISNHPCFRAVSRFHAVISRELKHGGNRHFLYYRDLDTTNGSHLQTKPNGPWLKYEKTENGVGNFPPLQPGWKLRLGGENGNNIVLTIPDFLQE